MCQPAVSCPNRGVQRHRPRSLAAASEIPARRSGRNTPIVPSAIRRWRNPHGKAVRPPSPPRDGVEDGGLTVRPNVGRGILDAPAPHSVRDRQGCRPLRRWWSAVRHGGGGKPPPYRVERTESLHGFRCNPAAGHAGPALRTIWAVRSGPFSLGPLISIPQYFSHMDDGSAGDSDATAGSLGSYSSRASLNCAMRLSRMLA